VSTYATFKNMLAFCSLPKRTQGRRNDAEDERHFIRETLKQKRYWFTATEKLSDLEIQSFETRVQKAKPITHGVLTWKTLKLRYSRTKLSGAKQV
jgi:hypothetical protein